jgi:hypothetical protein
LFEFYACEQMNGDDLLPLPSERGDAAIEFLRSLWLKNRYKDHLGADIPRNFDQRLELRDNIFNGLTTRPKPEVFTFG